MEAVGEDKIDGYSRISGSCGDGFLDRKIERREIIGCIKKKIGGSDELVGELFK